MCHFIMENLNLSEIKHLVLSCPKLGIHAPNFGQSLLIVN